MVSSVHTLLCTFQWDLFRLPELMCADAMLNRLFKQGLEQIVMSYEAYRMALIREMARWSQEKKASGQQRALQNTPHTAQDKSTSGQQRVLQTMPLNV